MLLEKNHWLGPRSPAALAFAAVLFLLTAVPCLAGEPAVRTYYIAAEEVVWDYAPSYPHYHMIGKEFDAEQRVFVAGNGTDRIGRQYKKAVFREYTDDTFVTQKPRLPEWEHLGILGPVIRASVGDTIRVVFKNKTPDQKLSMHPHGVFYRKDAEGTPYHDGTRGADKLDDAIAPGAVYTYVWEVPERAGPGPADPDSIVWLYHSHVDETKDTNTGLIGAIIISRQENAWPDARPRDVDRELVTLFTIFDENDSLYLEQNLKTYAPNADPEDEGFIESNLMHAINGFVYDNLPGLIMRQGERVRWYLVALGTETDLHTPHWHGNTVLAQGQRTDVIELLPASMKTVTMVADSPGQWMFHCHVNDHIKAGMMGMYTVLPQTAAQDNPD